MNKKFDDILNAIDKVEFERLYKEELMSLDALADHFGICQSTLKKIIAHLELSRDKHAVKSKSNSNAKQKLFQEKLDYISRETLYEYYILQDHDYYDTLQHFKITDWMFNRMLDKYNIKKDRKLAAQKGLQTKYQSAGSKELYDSKVENKQKETILTKYDTLEDYYTARRKKAEATNLARYGQLYKCIAELPEKHSELYAQVWHSKEASIAYLTSFTEKPEISILASELSCSINSVHLWIEKYDLGAYIKIKKSGYEDELIEYIQSLGFDVDRNNRTILRGQELDIYIPGRNLAIEFNGNYWHSIQQVGKNYHYQKSISCEQKGIRLIHIYQHQWLNPIKKEILKSIIRNALGKNENFIYARNCELRELSKNDVEEFSNKNSLHAHRNASIYLGLFHREDLVEIMSFGKAFFSRDPSMDYECIRSITKINTTVVGGMNKLFQYFVCKWKPAKILYYVDYNTHVGNSMNKLGFTFKGYSKHGCINIANCKEVQDKFGYAFNRKPNKHHEIQEYINQGKVLPIYDAGVKKYVWTNPNSLIEQDL